MKSQVVVLNANPIEMEDDNGKLLRGISVHFYPVDNLVSPVKDGVKLGLAPFKDFMPFELCEKLVSAPAIYDVDLKMSSAQGKMVMKISDLNFVSEVRLNLDNNNKKV